MNSYGTFDLDEHAAFWARDDEHAGRARERVEFSIEGQAFVAHVRRFTCNLARNRSKKYALCLIEGSNANLLFELLSKNGGNIGEMVEGQGASRTFCSPAPLYGARLRWDGAGAWFSRAPQEEGDAVFRWESDFSHSIFASPAEMLALPQDEFTARCLEQWRDSRSEMRRSWEFVGLTPAQRDDYVCQCQNANREELLALTRALGHWLWNVVPALENEKLTLNFYWANPHAETLELADFYRLRDHYQRWRTSILWALQTVYIGQQNKPKYIENWMTKRAPLRLKIKPPTQHEKIEAHAHLRDWARSHFSETEQNALFDLNR